MRKLIGKIIVWFLKDQVINFDDGCVQLPDYTNKENKGTPKGRFKVK